MKINNDTTARNAKLAKIHIAKKTLGMDDETYLEMLAEFGLKSSRTPALAS